MQCEECYGPLPMDVPPITWGDTNGRSHQFCRQECCRAFMKKFFGRDPALEPGLSLREFQPSGGWQ